MRATALFRSMPRRRRGKKISIATLVALSALAAGALTLAPTAATAMDDNGGAGECRSVPWAPPGAGWNGTEFCTLTDGSAGGGGGAGGGGAEGSGGGSGSSGTTVGEVIVIVDPYSPPKSTNPLCPSRHLCLPGQGGGGRPLGFADDGRNPREPKGRGNGPAPKKAEAPKGKAKPLTKEECKEIEESNLFIPSVVKRLEELDQRIANLQQEREQFDSRSRVLRGEIGELRAGLPDGLWWVKTVYGVNYHHSLIISHIEENYWEMSSRLPQILDRERRMEWVKNQDSSKFAELWDLEKERGSVATIGERETRAALRQCGKLYD